MARWRLDQASILHIIPYLPEEIDITFQGIDFSKAKHRNLSRLIPSIYPLMQPRRKLSVI